MAKRESAEKAIKDIRRKTRRHFSAEDKIRIVMEGLRGEESIDIPETERESMVEPHGVADDLRGESESAILPRRGAHPARLPGWA